MQMEIVILRMAEFLCFQWTWTKISFLTDIARFFKGNATLWQQNFLS